MSTAFRFLIAVFCGSFISSSVLAQTRGDTMHVDLEQVVVTAERYSNQLRESTSAIATMDRHDIERLPAKTLTDIIGLMPGIGFINRDGDGRDGLVTVRGFYGGGDVEYLVVLVDGLPFNDAETGLIAWETIPTINIERIELLRGGSSSLYGDAAIGGVLNIITRRDTASGGSLSLAGGSFETVTASGFLSETVGKVPLQLIGSYDKTSGFRENTLRRSGSINANATVVSRPAWKLGFQSINSWRIADMAGPLVTADLEAQEYISDRFKNDYTDDRRNALAVILSGARTKVSWRASVSGLIRQTESRSTLALAPQYADSRDRLLDARRLSFGASANYKPGSAWSVVAGIDAGAHENDSRYFKVTGPLRLDDANLPPVDRSAIASRTFVGAYTQASLNPLNFLSVTAGVRADALSNKFNPDQPTTLEAHSVTHSAVSPKVGLNVELVENAQTAMNVYLSAGTSFKSPALDQQYGLRTITVYFGPEPLDVSTSNGDLKPQRGSQLESGFYLSHQGVHGRTEFSASFYRLDMRDELDVDLATFQLVNIGRSRHDGAELGLNFNSPMGLSLFGNYTLQSTTFRNGDYSGNFVKAIPRDLYSFGSSIAFRNGIAVGFVGHGRRRTFVDDPNTVPLDDYLAVDVQGSISSDVFRFGISLLNVFDQEYSTTAYPDPSGGDAVFLFPAAGTSVKIGGTFSW